MRIINRYMNTYDVHFELQSRVRKYLEYTLKNEKNNSDSENLILSKLNKSLKNELLMESVGKFLKEIPFFSENFSNITIQRCVNSLRKLQLSPEEFLFHVKKKFVFEINT